MLRYYMACFTDFSRNIDNNTEKRRRTPDIMAFLAKKEEYLLPEQQIS